MVERHSNIKLWFSGHFHLSQNYADSISVVGSCAFVQTGVIGECNRDGNRCGGERVLGKGGLGAVGGEGERRKGGRGEIWG